MAEEKKVSTAEKKPGFLARVGNWFKNLPARIAKAFRNMVAELRKVTWPSKKKWITCSVTVLVFLLVMMVVVGLLDTGSSALIRWIGFPAAQTQTTLPINDVIPEATEAPAEATEAPAEATEVPAEATEAPAEATEVPAEATEAPAEATEAPAEATDAPVEPAV